jgi:hypothetical protein
MFPWTRCLLDTKLVLTVVALQTSCAQLYATKTDCQEQLRLLCCSAMSVLLNYKGSLWHEHARWPPTLWENLQPAGLGFFLQADEGAAQASSAQPRWSTSDNDLYRLCTPV